MGSEVQKKRILFVSGTRADFGKLKPLMRVAGQPPFECRVFATGMHTLSRYGWTYEEIKKEGFKDIFLYINQTNASGDDMDMVLANTITGLGMYIRQFPPDMIVIHGDRVEALAGVIVGALNNILVSHIEGGELSGTIDESIRHSITKLAHLHFVANEEARTRLIQMGEKTESIFAIGSPDIDVMLSDSLPTLAEAKGRYSIPFGEYMLFIYHPVTTEVHDTLKNIGEVVAALEESGRNFVVIYPNNDKGSDIIFESLERLKGSPRFKFYESLRFEHFLTLLKNARAIVGNSSAGIREAPVYGVPTVNIGKRQSNRFDHSSIINVPEDKGMILEAFAKLPGKSAPSLHFGKGDSAQLFHKVISAPELWDTPIQKHFTDLML